MRDYKLSLNLITNNNVDSKKFKQYDTGNEIELEVFQNENLREDEKLVLTDETILAFFKRRDGQVLQKNCIIRNGNIVVKTEKDVLGVPGLLELECLIKKDSIETTTQRMIFNIDESIKRDGAIEEDPRYKADLVTELLDVRDNVKSETIGKIEEVSFNLEENLQEVSRLSVKADDAINTATDAKSKTNALETNLNYKADKTTVDNLAEQVGQGVTDTQLNNAVQRKIDDGSISSLAVGNNAIGSVNIQTNAITESKIGFTGLRKGYFVSGGLNIDNVLGILTIKAGTYLMYENSFLTWASETVYSYTKSSSALYLLANKTTKSLSMSLVANLPSDNNVFCLGILFKNKLYSYNTENISVNGIAYGGFDTIENRSDVRIAENSYISGTLTSGKFIIDTVAKTIKTDGSTIVLAWHNRGVIIPSQNVSLDGLSGEIHFYYDKVEKVIKYNNVPYTSNVNFIFLGILYKGKIYNSMDKEIWEVDGVKNGGWYTPDSNMLYVPEVVLPNIIPCIVGDRIDFYYDNIILYSDYFHQKQYFVKPMIINSDGSYQFPNNAGYDGFTLYDYKFEYTAQTAKTIKVELRIENAYTGEIINYKRFNLVSVATSVTPKSFNMLSLGDSFTDGGVTKAMYEMFPRFGMTPNYIGLNSGNVSGHEEVRDEAYSGKGYIWYTQKDRYAEGQQLRSDRPLSDAYWDVGWGKNEPNGWTEGQTYNDLTTTQRSHGKTKNPFWNPFTSKFDFTYYVNTFLNDQRFDNTIYKPIGDDTPVSGRTVKHIDCVTSFAGLNDVIFMDKFYTGSYQQELLNAVKQIIDSILAYDPQIKIFISTVTPQRDKDESLQHLIYFDKNFKHYKKSKYMQELWNKLLLDMLYKDYNNKVFVIPTSANIDTRFAFETIEVHPNKFDSTYTERICKDIHPDKTSTGYGHKYLADMAKNVLYGNM